MSPRPPRRIARTAVAGVVLSACLSALATGAAAASFRIAEITGADGACHALEAGAPAGEKAYFAHLAARLGLEIQTCPVKDRAAAAKALEGGALDAAVLDPPTFGPVAAKTRAILTLRPEGRLHRVPMLAAARRADGAVTSLQSLLGKAIAIVAPSDTEVALAQKALEDQGLPPSAFARETRLADADAAAKQLRSGADAAIVLTTAAWQRLCQGERAKDNRCADLKAIWQGRERAALALVVRRDMPDALRLQLIGVHVALHLENKPAFAWASAWVPDAAEFEPTEAEALGAPSR